MTAPNLTREELAALDALIGHESAREGSYLDPVWRDVLQGAHRKIEAVLDEPNNPTGGVL